jgi:hypothetical protein
LRDNSLDDLLNSFACFCHRDLIAGPGVAGGRFLLPLHSAKLSLYGHLADAVSVTEGRVPPWTRRPLEFSVNPAVIDTSKELSRKPGYQVK